MVSRELREQRTQARREHARERLDTPRETRRLLRRPQFEDDTFGRFAEQFARFMGTARFLLYMTLFVLVWVGWNFLAPGPNKFDAYPFIFLTLMLSLQASYAAPLILLAQNRQEDRDRVIAEGDRQANQRAHADMEFLAREMASLRMALGEVATRDYVRSELRSLLQELEERTPREEGDLEGTERTVEGTVRVEGMSHPSAEQVTAALAGVDDPEIRRPITELGMVDAVDIDPAGRVAVRVLLTVPGCPMRERLTTDVTAAVRSVAGVTGVEVAFGVMDEQQRSALQASLRGGRAQREIPFARPDSLTKVYAIASGKGGVGKSSVTVNLAVAMARAGRKVGIVDADIYGHSVAAMLGVADARPTQVEDLIMPVPTDEGPSVISIGMLKPRRDQVVAWRGPMLDRALVQMLSDVYWGDLDTLLLDLPPGTGDIAISLGQHLPNAEVVVVTTPQEAAAEVAERAGTMASMMRQRVVGVVENMSFLACPHCGPAHRLDVFGSGGGARVAATLSQRFGYEVPVLGEVPLDLRLREGGDTGRPIVSADPSAPAAAELARVARALSGRGRNLAGMQLGLSPAGRV